jgi:3-deoxy-manno-octulosonate cytidylyltransferase (CMP-KDO synthetase)
MAAGGKGERQRVQRALAIVPARLSSTRLPRKMLLRDSGRFLFEHTVRNAERARALECVVLATDAEEIAAAARSVGIEVVLTSPEHPSGTDRVREAFQRLTPGGVDVVVNLQGDEPELDPADLDALVAAFAEPEVEVATLCAPVAGREEALSASVVKVVRDARGDALYFSRSPLPALEHPAKRAGAPGYASVLRHIGIYAFRPRALEAFCALAPSPLELAESLEQLRWLEAGKRMRVLTARRATAGIDTEEEYAAFVARCAGKERAGQQAETGIR